MASLIETLAGGVSNAPSGTAEFYIQGTGTLQTVYSDNEGTVVVAAPHGLDANGAINRYVKGRTDVVVRTQGGAVAKTFTFGGDAREVRVENAGFTGTLAGGGTGPGGRTTVDAILTMLFASLGAVDGKALVNGVATNISTALASSSGIFYSLKAYGAVGDNTTNDTSAIQACVNAAINAGGGIVFVNHGNYKITAAITVPAGSKVVILGESETGCIITQHTSGINGWLTFGTDSAEVSNITFARNTTAMSGRALQSAGKLNVRSCTFQGFAGTQLYAETATTTINAWGCSFDQTEAGSRMASAGASGAKVRFSNCHFAISVGSATSFDGAGGQFDLDSCTMTMSAAATSGVVFASGTVARFTGGRVDTGAVGSGTYSLSSGGTLVLAGSTIDGGAGATQLSSAGALYESGNSLGSTVTLGSPSTVFSEKRDRAVEATTTYSVDGPYSYTPDAMKRHHRLVFNHNSAGTHTITINNPSNDNVPVGSCLTLLLQNPSNQDMIAGFVTWGANYNAIVHKDASGGLGGASAGAGGIDSLATLPLNFVKYATGAGGWILVSGV